MAGVNTCYRDGFIVDSFEFYANRRSRAAFCLPYGLHWSTKKPQNNRFLELENTLLVT